MHILYGAISVSIICLQVLGLNLYAKEYEDAGPHIQVGHVQAGHGHAPITCPLVHVGRYVDDGPSTLSSAYPGEPKAELEASFCEAGCPQPPRPPINNFACKRCFYAIVCGFCPGVSNNWVDTAAQVNEYHRKKIQGF